MLADCGCKSPEAIGDCGCEIHQSVLIEMLTYLFPGLSPYPPFLNVSFFPFLDPCYSCAYIYVRVANYVSAVIK